MEVLMDNISGCFMQFLNCQLDNVNAGVFFFCNAYFLFLKTGLICLEPWCHQDFSQKHDFQTFV